MLISEHDEEGIDNINHFESPIERYLSRQENYLGASHNAFDNLEQLTQTNKFRNGGFNNP